MKYISIKERKQWNEIVTSFQDYDIYYLSDYVKAFQIHGDGEPYLLYFENDGFRGMNVVMKRDVSKFEPFNKLIKPSTYFDIVTPYGYGGFIFEGDPTDLKMTLFYEDCIKCAIENNIISLFVRYHPQIRNADCMRALSNVTDLGKTISIDLESKEKIWSNFSSNNRNNIRKSENSGVKILHGKNTELLNNFMNIYNATMMKDNADSYYYFTKDFYDSIHSDLNNNYEMFYAVLNDNIIAISIMFFANSRMHCHLCASVYEYRNFAPTNLMFYKAACWGSQLGFKTMHIGGGVGSADDDLFRFKKSFNRNSDNTFSIGKEIFNQEVYDSLVGLRKKMDPEFNDKSNYFPLYRAI